jgi:hypothetical protein
MADSISKHDAYTTLKDLEAAYIYPPVKEAHATAARRIDQIKPADVQPVISGDNCIVCGRNVHKDDVYYDVNGGTICEACMNTKCKCKNGR